MKKILTIIFCLFIIRVSGFSQNRGYYRYPSIAGKTVAFTAEGDIWLKDLETGITRRLTTNLGLEYDADISPDGKWVAYVGEYEGPSEIYLLPISGGVPKRITYEGTHSVRVIGWTSDNRIIYASGKYSTLPGLQLFIIDPETMEEQQVPLAQASYGSYGDDGTLYFTRLPFQGSHTKRYKGGTAQNIWKFARDGREAVPLTPDYPGTSKDPMWYKGNVYFTSDRDGTMNIWSMDPEGKNLKQLTFSKGWDIQSPDMDADNIVYQKGADICLFNVSTGTEDTLDIRLTSDFDQRRPQWIKDPIKTITHIDISDDGSRLAITARGRVFTAPIESGRWAEITRKSGVRYRDAQFLSNDMLAFMSDESGEMEWWTGPANGIGNLAEISSGNHVTMLAGAVSPDGKRVVYFDKNFKLNLLNFVTKEKKQVDESDNGGYYSLSWSPDSKWIAYAKAAENDNAVISLYELSSGQHHEISTDRLDSWMPVWSADGKWLYFLTDREFKTIVYSPWGSRQPEPYYSKTTKIFAYALYKTDTFPFQPLTELTEKKQAEKSEETKTDKGKNKKQSDIPVEEAKPYDLEGMNGRLYEVPVEAGNINQLFLTKDHLFWSEREDPAKPGLTLKALKITHDRENKPVEIGDGILRIGLSGNRKKVFIQKENGLYVFDANGSKPDLDKKKVQLVNWTFRIDPREDWHQMLVDAWRLERDYFYDPDLHHLDWESILKKNLPLVNRVTDRYELDDLLAQMVSELSALHTFVYGGVKRVPADNIPISSLGARLTRNHSLGGYIIEHIYRNDPDYPDNLSPLAKPGLHIREGDIITAVNGVSTLSADNISELMPDKVGQQVRLSLKRSDGSTYDEIVIPISTGQESSLRYSDWEYSRRMKVEEKSHDSIGYVHLRAMGGNNYVEWIKDFYPVFKRQGLIIDMRHNRGGNIDSWVLEKLLRKAWFYWQPRIGQPSWNMQYAFRGHLVVLCDQYTASDGEAFTEGFKRLGMGKVIGMRTWGGEIWLSSSNRLVDNGIATAAETGVYGPEGKWLIEGHGVDPDMVVDNLPHATFTDNDAQLDAAIRYLKEEIRKDPRPVPKHPPYPDKSFDYGN